MTDSFLSFEAVQRIAGDKSRTTIWRWCKAGRFPRPRQLGPNSIGWLESEVQEWVERCAPAAQKLAS